MNGGAGIVLLVLIVCLTYIIITRHSRKTSVRRSQLALAAQDVHEAVGTLRAITHEIDTQLTAQHVDLVYLRMLAQHTLDDHDARHRKELPEMRNRR